MLATMNTDIKKQSGAVLVMALVMLAVLTLIGVASMESSSIQLKVASNTQEHKIAFQSAQTMISFITSEDPVNTIDYQNVTGATQTIAYPYSADTSTASNAVVSRVGCSAGIGDSLEAGKGQKYNFYDAQVTGFNNSNAALASSNSVQVQGIRYFAAGC